MAQRSPRPLPKTKDEDEESGPHPSSEAARAIRRSTKPPSINVFYDMESGVYTSLTTEYMPLPPPVHQTLRNIFNGLRPRWAYDDLFYLALVPVQPVYELPMLDCLLPMAFKTESTITNRVRRYRMDNHLCKQWQMLENIANRLLRKLLARTAGTYLLTVVPPPPHSFRYSEEWPTEEKIALASRLARTAFTLRFALMSYLVLKESLKFRKTWQELTQDEHDPVPLPVCNVIRASWVCDFSIPRIGAFVDISGRLNPDGGRQWHEDIDDFLISDIPLWFGYGFKAELVWDAGTITKLEFHRHKPELDSGIILRSVTTKCYNSDNDAYRAAQVETNSDSTMLINYPKSDYYGYVVQMNQPGSVITRALVRSRSAGTARYEVALVNGMWYDRLVDDKGKPHQQYEQDTVFLRYRQTLSDTYRSFVECETRALLYLLSTAGRDIKEKIRIREELNQGQPVPTRTGAVVFVWQLECGRQYRRRVRTGRIRELWDRTTMAQRTYNALRNEYDVDDTSRDTILPDPSILSELNESQDLPPSGSRRSRSASPTPRPSPAQRTRSPIRAGRGPGGQSTDEQTIQPLIDFASGVADDTANFAAEEEFTSVANTLLSDSDRTVNIQEPCVDVLTESIHTILKERYGYIAPTTTWTMGEMEAQEWESNAWKKLYRTLGQREKKAPSSTTSVPNVDEPSPTNTDSSSTPGFTPQELPCIGDFVAALRRNATIPALCDLDPSSTITCADISYASLSALRYEATETQSGQSVARPWYMLESIEGQPLETSMRCRVSTQLATNIQHAKCAGFGRTADEILMSMVARGMTTHISMPLNNTVVVSKRKVRSAPIGGRPVGVSIKPHSVKLSALDYKTYMEMRDQLLSGPVGAAALREGGILWRLAVNVCSIEDTIQGPDTDSPSEEVQIGETQIGGRRFVENILSQQDKYVIVGVYQVLIDGHERSDKAEAASITSWWPTAEAWQQGGFNVGYWSAEAEYWYQKRVRSIMANEATPYTTSEWRTHLRHTKSDSRKFLDHIEDHSARKL